MDGSTAFLSASTAPGWRLARDFRDVRVHLIGIGGSGMCGLAAMLMRRGARVSGSDRAPSDVVRGLVSRGARISFDQSEQSFPHDTQLVVASAAIPNEHPEMRAAAARGIEVMKYAQMVGELMAQRSGIAIAGTHGKSTTTAWTTFALRSAGLDPSFVIGAEVEQLGGGSGVGDGAHFVAEACEYDRSFLNFRPRFGAILNIEEDHLDYYKDLSAISDAFHEFASLLPSDGLLVTSGEDQRCRKVAERLPCPVHTFGLSEECTWQAKQLELRDGRYSFTVCFDGVEFGRVQLGIAGRHNVMNALAVTALAHRCGVDWDTVARALNEFHGARRRLEQRAIVGGVTICDDYAHHPTEIRATLRAARERFEPRRLWCIFQPHQHSRTRFLLEDFARSFECADRVVVPQIFFVRDSERERDIVCAEDLVERTRASGVEAEYIPDFKAIVALLQTQVQPGDLVITMGAGDIWKVADELAQRLRGNLPG